MKKGYRPTHLALTLFAPLALLFAVRVHLLADNNAYSFQGQYTAPACGPPFEFTIGAGTKTIDVVASTIPANDIVLKLYHPNGSLLIQQDTGTSPEPIHYAKPAGADLDAGKYSVVVCPFNGEAALSPSDYAGLVTVSELPLPPITPPGSTTNPVTVYPIPKFESWNAKFTPATVVDPQRTEGEPLIKIDPDGNLWESGRGGSAPTCRSSTARPTTARSSTS